MSSADDQRLVATLDSSAVIVFLSGCGLVLALFAVVAHPRWLARVFAGPAAGETRQGFMFRRSRAIPRVTVKRSESSSSTSSQDTLVDEKAVTTKSHPFEQGFNVPVALSIHHRRNASSCSGIPLQHKTSTALNLRPFTSQRADQLPPYFPSLLPVMLRLPLPRALGWVTVSPLSFGQAAVLIGYFLIAAGSMLYYTNPVTNPTRSGLIATVQLPLIVALGAKNSVVPWLIAKGSEKLNFLHRFIGRSIFLCTTFHVGIYLHKYPSFNAFYKSLGKPVIGFGVLAYIGLCVLTLSSIPVIRRKAYAFFQIAHWLGFMALLLGLIWHVDICRPFAFTSLGIYSLDLLVRLTIKTRFAQATLVPLSDGRTTLIEIPGLTTGWRAGQYAYIRVLTPGMGLLANGMWAAHPFTIASSGVPVASRNGEVQNQSEPLRFFVKRTENAHGWTGRLLMHASSAAGDEERNLVGKRCTVIVDGPYGGTGNTLFSAFTSVLLMAGGSGITFALAQVSSLMSKSLQGGCRARTLDLIWIIRSETDLRAFLPYLMPLLEPESDNKPRLSTTNSSSYNLTLQVTIHVYITRPDECASFDKLPRHPRLIIKSSRPDLLSLTDAKLEETLHLVRRTHASNACGLAFGVCGPQGLVRSVRDIVGGLKSKRVSEVGGVELFAETFGM